MPQDWFSQNAPTKPAAAAATGGDWFAANAPKPDFTSSNEKDAAGGAAVDPDEGIGAALRHWWSVANPAQIGQMLPWPKALGGSGVDNPLMPGGADEDFAPKFVRDMHATRLEADRLWAKGEKGRATAKYVASVIPLFGSLLSQMGDEVNAGKWMAMFGDTAGLATMLGTPQIVDAAKAGAGRVVDSAGDAARAVMPKTNLNAAEAASNDFAREQGVPLDAATATGSRSLRAVQKVVGNTVAGESPAAKMIDEQRAALKRVGEQQAEAANPGGTAQTPETAATGAVDSIKNLIAQLHDQASKAYGTVRQAEATNVDRVPVPEDPSVLKGRQYREKASVGYNPSETVRQHLREMVEELDSVRYSDGKNVRDSLDTSDSHYVPRSANAPVYHDIKDAIPNDTNVDHYTNGDIRKAIESALETGHYTNAAKGALTVAEARAAGKWGAVSKPLFDPMNEAFSRGRTDMGLAIDLRDAKTALRPVFDRMNREGQLAPLMGDQARALRALDKVVNGPDHASLSDVDAALGDLKALARGGKNGPTLPELRSTGQGKAALIVSQLEKLVRERAAAAGPDVLRALEEGRAATRAKADVGDLFDTLQGEPVKAFNTLTAPKDANVNLLRRVRESAPANIPDIARAWMEQRLELAQREGGFGHGAKNWADWSNLGPETKRILFASPGQAEALDHFFLLAKRLEENPNPSGTAHTIGAALNIGAAAGLVFHPLAAASTLLGPYAVSKLLYTRAGVEALTRWMTANAPTRAAGRAAAVANPAARSAAWAAVVQAGRRAGVDVPATVPAAADKDESR